MGSDPKMPTTPRMTTDKLSAAFPALIPKGKVSTMSWNDQVSAEEGRNLVFGPETASSHSEASSPYTWTIEHDLWIS